MPDKGKPGRLTTPREARRIALHILADAGREKRIGDDLWESSRAKPPQDAPKGCRVSIPFAILLSLWHGIRGIMK